MKYEKFIEELRKLETKALNGEYGYSEIDKGKAHKDLDQLKSDLSDK